MTRSFSPSKISEIFLAMIFWTGFTGGSATFALTTKRLSFPRTEGQRRLLAMSITTLFIFCRMHHCRCRQSQTQRSLYDSISGWPHSKIALSRGFANSGLILGAFNPGRRARRLALCPGLLYVTLTGFQLAPRRLGCYKARVRRTSSSDDGQAALPTPERNRSRREWDR